MEIHQRCELSSDSEQDTEVRDGWSLSAGTKVEHVEVSPKEHPSPSPYSSLWTSMHQALFSHNSVWKWQTVLQVAHPPQYFIFIMFREFCLNVYAFQFGPSSISFRVTVPLFPLGAYSSIMPFSARALMLKEVN